jgi:hypothetical protein
VGAIDILVNNAGMQRRAPLEDFARTLARADAHQPRQRVLRRQAVARNMIPRKRGKIINICSVQSELGRPGIAPYTASKGAVKMLTKGMAIDWGQHGINVNGLGPGYFKTELNAGAGGRRGPQFSSWLIGRTPSRRWGDVEDLAGAAVFLASDASRFVNGHILYVDGGVDRIGACLANGTTAWWSPARRCGAPTATGCARRRRSCSSCFSTGLPRSSTSAWRNAAATTCRPRCSTASCTRWKRPTRAKPTCCTRASTRRWRRSWRPWARSFFNARQAAWRRKFRHD